MTMIPNKTDAVAYRRRKLLENLKAVVWEYYDHPGVHDQEFVAQVLDRLANLDETWVKGQKVPTPILQLVKD